MKTASAVLLALLCSALPGWAVLGGRVATVQSDQAKMRGTLRSVVQQGYTVHEITGADGTIVKEFVSPDGVVFGISWRAKAMPVLSNLLGGYFAQFQVASKSAVRRRRGVVLHTGQLVVESGGHPRDFRGRAYVPALVPQNLTPAVIQ